MTAQRRIKSIWKNNGLSIVVFALFAAFLVAQCFTGWVDENAERLEHGLMVQSLWAYLCSGSFLEVTMENWESEFLQMFAYVLLTAMLYQRGSAESKAIPDESSPDDSSPDNSSRPQQRCSPRTFKRWLYEHSLSLAFLALFLFAFVLHAIGGMENYNEQLALHRQPALTLLQYFISARFWFESFQNWQSEFLSLGAMAVLSIFLREKGSPESKPV
ncbi:MAG: hypothetical protein QM808_16620 [Steroidobacteraceae bacterium]